MYAGLLRLVILPHDKPGYSHAKLFKKPDRELEANGVPDVISLSTGFRQNNFRCNRNESP